VMVKNVVVLGGGGREHAIVCALRKSSQVGVIYVLPGNGGTALMDQVENILQVSPTDGAHVAKFALEKEAALVVIGPEAPLVAGVSDAVRAVGIPVFGPSKEAAEIEASKAWSKKFMQRHGLRTAHFEVFSRNEISEAKAWITHFKKDVVIKASGLAAGKGVLVPPCGDFEAACAAVDELAGQPDEASDEIVIEERLCGPEMSLLAWCDGEFAVCMPPAQDHKRALFGDRGKNTGGMGAYAPSCAATPAQLNEARRMMQTAVSALKEEGRPFIGCLYGGFMLDPQLGVSLLEFNARFGDPEAQVILPLLESDCFDAMLACAIGNLGQGCSIKFRNASAATVVLASKGYPGSYAKGKLISGLAQALSVPGASIFHAGTNLKQNKELITSGGRVVACTAVAAELKGALRAAYAAATCINFDGVFYRGDVGRTVLDAKLKVGVLGSTRGTSLQPILDAAAQPDCFFEIVSVLSNKKDALILEKGRNARVPDVGFISCLTAQNKKMSRAEYEEIISERLENARVECVLLVGWMRILTSTFVKRWQGRCLNVHPSLLPDYAGGMDLEVHAAVLKDGQRESGCTVHFVTDQVDGGEIVAQRICPVLSSYTKPEQLKATVQALEGPCLLDALRRFAQGDAGTRFFPRKAYLSSTTQPKDIQNNEIITYRAAGVDIDAGNTLVELIKPLAAATRIPGVIDTLGGFGAVFDLSAAGFGAASTPSEDQVLLVSGTDGVGTKLKLAAEARLVTGFSYDQNLGVDLVAMCANDVATTGAQPLFFLDYYATGKLDPSRCADVVAGVALGCKESGCALVGGETAEMPGVYKGDDYDIAGFCVGALRRKQLLPKKMNPGDVLIGIPSSGIHANGFSLVRKLIDTRLSEKQNALSKPASSFFQVQAKQNENKSLADILLAPTKLYAAPIAVLSSSSDSLLAAAHITGGGLLENLPRVLPDNLNAHIHKPTILPFPPLFQWLQSLAGELPDKDMLRTFNCGIGLVLVVAAAHADTALIKLKQYQPKRIGILATSSSSSSSEERVHILDDVTFQ